MTALSELERLETTGLWRETAGAQRREVVVSLGDASLIISDTAGRALSHWSLPAIARLSGPSDRPAVYQPAADAEELLELDDETMIDALTRVSRAIERAQPKPGRLRGLIIAGVLILAIALAVFWLPGALVTQATRVVPEATRVALGEALLIRIQRVAGPRCDTPSGTRALDKLTERLIPEGGRIVVLSSGVQTAAHLPGPIVLINRALIEDYEDPSVVAGYVLAERARAKQVDPLERLLHTTGFVSSVRLLTTGMLKDETLDRYAETFLTTAPSPISNDLLLAEFARMQVLSTPYAYARDITGEETLGLIEANPTSATRQKIVLGDGSWIALQGICSE
ncbi:hypothetical protein ACP2AV_12760 [Aliiroseovarius sp. PTFE2010]|uniref:hypothetical protein n=1 Tax=Aliiroseovarius sp. PTFE2010 TaxID=3417190 RepID=UPI003CEE1D9E